MTAKLSIESSSEAATIAADWVMEHCRQAGLRDSPAFRVMTCVVEAVNNCVEHAYRDTRGEIGIRVYRNSHWLVLQIQDHGHPAPRQESSPTTEPLQTDGRGWFIMRRWMDIALYRRRKLKNVVTMVKYLS